jgi:NhaP-type Na+/H+ or K+/H+ antiporter
MFYLILGLILGPLGLELFFINPLDEVELLERIAEMAVIVSLFNAGLKLRKPVTDKSWGPPIKLAFLSMILTVGLISLAGYYLIGLPIGAAIILGAVLAPTDPVLASEVQLKNPEDKNSLRFSLTGEAGMNDGTVFPFVMLGLGLMGLNELGDFGLQWLAVDVIWAILGGVLFGALTGFLISEIILLIKKKHKENLERDEFIAIGLIGLSYGGALLIHTYGFLSVFAAAVALRSIEIKRSSSGKRKDAAEEQKNNSKIVPKDTADSVLGFNEQMEGILEVAVVVLLGAIISYTFLPDNAFWLIPFLFFIVRPAAVFLGLAGTKINAKEKYLIAWFGIRGIGSIYYLFYSIRKGLSDEIASQLITYTLIVIVFSIIVHGITVTPLMKKFGKEIS